MTIVLRDFEADAIINNLKWVVIPRICSCIIVKQVVVIVTCLELTGPPKVNIFTTQLELYFKFIT